MEWKNDILSFSGFDYGVASKKQKKLTAEVHEQQSETKLFEDLDETELVDEPQKIETTREPASKSKYKFDPMTERKIENFYFRNVEQAERKLKMLSNLKSKMSVSPAGEEIFKCNHAPSEPSKPAVAAKVKNATICDDEPATSKLPPPPPCIVMPPDVKPAPPPPAPVVKPAAPPVLVVSPAPVTTDPLTPYSPATLNSTLSFTEKWMGEETAKIWLEKVDFMKTKQEFEQIQNVVVPVDACKKWKANRALNQPSQDDFPVLDANLVVFENTYVNMSAIDVALPKSKIFMCQIPLKGSEEAFWKTAFDRQISYMEIITDQEPIEFFPIGNGEHVYHGTMFVNNRRVEAVSEDVTRFAIEVLPEGCSNSIICTITIVKNWSPDSVHAKQAVVIKEIIEMTTFLTKAKDENALVMSKHGAGRAGYFVALAVVVHKLDKATEPPIQEIVKSLRGQRPRAVESLTQYVSLYTTLFYYIKRKIGRSDGDKKAAMECDEPTCKKTVQLTTTFTNALIAEVNAAAGRSTLTVTIK
ncbi:hypothetical protein L5515_015132 [Caenorhabditis briggsae]|uniref:Tyrosine-protein phosphatase domain-containing protein n=2 Tax=Caenorhabditis briggsae TaxID=6238 RepID=A0AAE9J8X1_CAEBR|nr:hypothetical protein L5515_015132 [Caenorhabditis briggsae]